jgi:hypothetical protein
MYATHQTLIQDYRDSAAALSSPKIDEDAAFPPTNPAMI